MLTIQVDEMPSGKKPGHRLGARAILVFLPENDPHQATAGDELPKT
jgi:hypothetical protein